MGKKASRETVRITIDGKTYDVPVNRVKKFRIEMGAAKIRRPERTLTRSQFDSMVLGTDDDYDSTPRRRRR